MKKNTVPVWLILMTFALVLAMVDCVIPRPAQSPDAGCPGAELPCLTQRVCTRDGSGKCPVCRCAPAPFYPLGEEPGTPYFR